VLCIASSALGVSRQWAAVLATGNQAVWLDCPAVREWVSQTSPDPTRYSLVQDEQLTELTCQSVLFEGDTDALKKINLRIASRPGAIGVVQGRTQDALLAGQDYILDLLVREQSISTNTAAAGGNATLMTIG
jgi:RHH-type proline utilization regulon transcriptional repressor/proline dehydrogenase/delta 1-pyrroline-5-carboxylate dehydrogenase